MSRRDTIIIAVLVNAGLLAILFMMAIHVDEQPAVTPPEVEEVMAFFEKEDEPVEIKPELLAIEQDGIEDEVDLALQEFIAAAAIVDTQPERKSNPTPTLTPTPLPVVEPATVVVESQAEFIKVTVKKGDSLDKIARKSGTTVQKLKEINHLTKDLLNVGQVLQVPAGGKPIRLNTEVAETSLTSEVEYYTIKKGDNPWKIAKQFHVKFEKLLELNNLNEEKARNLKAGDRLRVK